MSLLPLSLTKYQHRKHSFSFRDFMELLRKLFKKFNLEIKCWWWRSCKTSFKWCWFKYRLFFFLKIWLNMILWVKGFVILEILNEMSAIKRFTKYCKKDLNPSTEIYLFNKPTCLPTVCVFFLANFEIKFFFSFCFFFCLVIP